MKCIASLSLAIKILKPISLGNAWFGIVSLKVENTPKFWVPLVTSKLFGKKAEWGKILECWATKKKSKKPFQSLIIPFPYSWQQLIYSFPFVPFYLFIYYSTFLFNKVSIHTILKITLKIPNMENMYLV